MRALVLSDWLAQRLQRESREPIYRQLHRLLQEAVLSRQLIAGARLPSSRMLAAELSVGRNTVTQVYEQLALEGYVSSATGRGTFVADTTPDEIVLDDGSSKPAPSSNVVQAVLSSRGGRLIAGAGVSSRQGGAFMPGIPDFSRFPGRVWSRLQMKQWRRPQPELMTYAPPGGLVALRKVLGEYLRTARSVRCTPDQIVITTGIHQSIDLAARLLTDPGDIVWTEDPCYWGVRSILQASGLELKPIRVDEEGIAPSHDDLSTPPKVILVTPSHQYPLGMVMSLARRRMLLEYGRQHRSWIIEDDYDSEFRYSNRPLASLQGMDDAGQVIYVGSFGKTMFPGLRVGYVVVPEALAASFAVASAELYREGQLLQQAVLADFMLEGHFTSHIRRMRGLYRQRRDLLLSAVERRYGDTLQIIGSDAGLHLVLCLPDAVDDRAVTAAALEVDIIIRPLSSYFSNRERAGSGLVIGYACVPDEAIRPAFEALADVLDVFLGIS
jgi:GntR family transcriptional regulator/MocR family aminotransferase